MGGGPTNMTAASRSTGEMARVLVWLGNRCVGQLGRAFINPSWYVGISY